MAGVMGWLFRSFHRTLVHGDFVYDAAIFRVTFYRAVHDWWDFKLSVR